MKKILSYLWPAVPVAIILGTMIFSHSCANTTTPPSGGPKDTIPPIITEIYPELSAVSQEPFPVPSYGKSSEV